MHNFIRRHTVDLARRFGVHELSFVVPPHITIKQPFKGDELEPHARYLDELAHTTEPFELRLGGFGFFEVERGIVFLDVDQDPRLKALQARIVRELDLEPALYEDDRPAPYHFHATIADGLTPGQLADVRSELEGTEPPIFRFPLERLGLFLSLDGASWTLFRRVRVL